MKRGMTRKALQDMIKGKPAEALNPHLFEDVKEPPKDSKIVKSKVRNKTKEWIGKNLWYWCWANKRLLLTEQIFHEERMWRFDFIICGIRVAIEYEGLMSEKSRHTTIDGFTGDAEKYNAAQSQGITVLRYTAKNYKSLLTDLNKFL